VKKLIAIAILAALAGCGKKAEEPVPAPQVQQTPTRPSNCWQGTIILVEGGYTIFETTTAYGAKARVSRSGNWGTPGETFDYCE
jgi:hypothetical protein